MVLYTIHTFCERHVGTLSTSIPACVQAKHTTPAGTSTWYETNLHILYNPHSRETSGRLSVSTASCLALLLSTWPQRFRSRCWGCIHPRLPDTTVRYRGYWCNMGELTFEKLPKYHLLDTGFVTAMPPSSWLRYALIPRTGAIHANYILCITCKQGTCFV